jgi:RNA polymerase sigma-70 factor (ECF subfamily)
MEHSELEFRRIYADFQPKILRYMGRMVGEREAEDLTQEVFVKVNRALTGFRGESSLSTWLYRIATNAALDRRRSPSFQHSAPYQLDDASQAGEAEAGSGDVQAGEKAPSAEEQLIRQEMNACIRDFVERLPENYRTTLVLSELEGFKNNEIAEILGISLETVKIRLHRARAKLKKELVTHCDVSWIEENEYLPDLRCAFERSPR